MLYILISLALLVLSLAVWALLWAIKNRQFDNLETHAWSVVLDDDRAPPPEKTGVKDSAPGPDKPSVDDKKS